MSREAHVLVALRVGAVTLENKGERVAWRQQGLSARMMAVSRILVPTELSQNLLSIENLGKRERKRLSLQSATKMFVLVEAA